MIIKKHMIDSRTMITIDLDEDSVFTVFHNRLVQRKGWVVMRAVPFMTLEHSVTFFDNLVQELK